MPHNHTGCLGSLRNQGRCHPSMQRAGKRQKQQQQQKLTPLNEGKTVRHWPCRAHLDPRRRKRNGAGCRANPWRQSRGENFLDIPLYRMTRRPDAPIASSVQALSPQVTGSMNCALGAATQLIAVLSFERWEFKRTILKIRHLETCPACRACGKTLCLFSAPCHSEPPLRGICF